LISSHGFAQEGNSLHALLSKGYEALKRDPAEAIPFFREAVVLDFKNATLRKQLGSAYIAVNRSEEALSQFVLADQFFPSDSTKLQIAYIFNSLGHLKESSEMFTLLKQSEYPWIKRTAEQALIVLRPALAERLNQWWGRFSFVTQYDTRFDNTVFYGTLAVGRYFEEEHLISAYGMLSQTRDTRSAGGAIPVIFSDNYLLEALGFRLTPFTGFAAEAQAGVAFDLDERPDRHATRGDFRALVTHGYGVYASSAFPTRAKLSWKPWTDVYSSIGYYSRYENVIAYHKWRMGIRFFEAGALGMDIYLVGNFGWDTNREFYNNIAEGGVGFRLVPDYSWGLNLVAEVHRGFYWDHALSTTPWSRWYGSTRFALVVERPLNF
jgi:tetratricopeptide (TPR) repeat protein